MRLVNVRTYQLEDFRGRRPPRYAIVSHRWGEEEVTFVDAQHGEFEHKYGYYKIEGACRKAYEYDLDWIWLDTCCIDKSSSAELTEAINSMFDWYRRAEICLVYLHDYCSDSKTKSFGECEWFERGWTLQELIAPSTVAFFDRNWGFVGMKSDLSRPLAQITGVDIRVLQGADPSTCSIAQRMSWASKRKTTQVEDQAYCLLGLFNVSMPLLYGSGKKAFLKLQEEIIKEFNEHTIFAWDRCFPHGRRSGLFAHSPACFAACQDIVQAERFTSALQGFTVTNIGISINLFTIPYAMNTYFAILECCQPRRPDYYYGIFLERLAADDQFSRVEVDGRSVIAVRLETLRHIDERQKRPLLVRQVQIDQPLQQNYAFWLRSLKLPGYEKEDLCRAKIHSRDNYTYRNNGLGILRIPNGQCGTAGIVEIRSQSSDKPWWRVQYLVFGFNEDFVPYCMLGNCDLGIESHTFVRRVIKMRNGGVRPNKDMFSNSWLLHPPSASNRPNFKARSFCVIDSDPFRKQSTPIEYLGLIISFQLVPAPSEIDGLVPKPWTVWAVDVRRDAGPSPQRRAEREALSSNAKEFRKSLVGSASQIVKQTVFSSIGADMLEIL